MAKTTRKIKATEFMRDIRSGMGETALEEKYRLSRQSFQWVISQLIQHQLLTNEELISLFPSLERQPEPNEEVPPEEPAAETQASRAAEDALAAALREQLAVKSHLSFAEEVLNRYDWDEQTRQEFHDQFAAIRAREGDTRLFLGVVGEFGTGKSTLINAFLRQDLLRSDIIQQTTATATELHYGSRLEVEVSFRNGVVKRFNDFGHAGEGEPAGTEKQRIVDYIHRVTADEDTAKGVEKVVIHYPAKILAEGLVIIDTPGTNVDNERHTDVTQETIRDRCDAAVVVIPADIPVSQTLCAFLNSDLSEVLHRCVFVVTKMDLIRAREKERQISAIHARLKRSLGIDDPLVLPAAPRAILDGLNGDREELPDDFRQEYPELEREFQNMEATLRKTMHRQRLMILLDRLSVLLGRLLEILKYNLELKATEVKSSHEALERNRIPDLEVFAEERKKYYIDEQDRRVAWVLPFFQQRTDKLKELCLNGILLSIIYAKDAGDLQSRLRNYSNSTIRNAAMLLNGEAATTCQFIDFSGDRQHEAFRGDFKVAYKRLVTLGGHIQEDEAKIESAINAMIEGHYVQANQLITESVDGNQEMGSLVLLLGSLFSGIADRLLGPSLKEKEKCWQEISEKATQCFSDLDQQLTVALQQAMENERSRIRQYVDAYCGKYNDKARDMQQQDEMEMEALKNLEHQTIEDLEAISLRQTMLDEVQSRLRQF